MESINHLDYLRLDSQENDEKIHIYKEDPPENGVERLKKLCERQKVINQQKLKEEAEKAAKVYLSNLESGIKENPSAHLFKIPLEIVTSSPLHICRNYWMIWKSFNKYE